MCHFYSPKPAYSKSAHIIIFTLILHHDGSLTSASEMLKTVSKTDSMTYLLTNLANNNLITSTWKKIKARRLITAKVTCPISLEHDLYKHAVPRTGVLPQSSFYVLTFGATLTYAAQYANIIWQDSKDRVESVAGVALNTWRGGMETRSPDECFSFKLLVFFF